jgi:hypothetical protein
VRFSLPKSTLENWLRDLKAGKIEKIGKSHRSIQRRIQKARFPFVNTLTAAQTAGRLNAEFKKYTRPAAWIL